MFISQIRSFYQDLSRPMVSLAFCGEQGLDSVPLFGGFPGGSPGGLRASAAPPGQWRTARVHPASRPSPCCWDEAGFLSTPPGQQGGRLKQRDLEPGVGMLASLGLGQVAPVPTCDTGDWRPPPQTVERIPEQPRSQHTLAEDVSSQRLLGR